MHVEDSMEIERLRALNAELVAAAEKALPHIAPTEAMVYERLRAAIAKAKVEA
jgi:hypothetical protein